MNDCERCNPRVTERSHVDFGACKQCLEAEAASILAKAQAVARKSS